MRLLAETSGITIPFWAAWSALLVYVIVFRFTRMWDRTQGARQAMRAARGFSSDGDSQRKLTIGSIVVIALVWVWLTFNVFVF